MTDDLLALLRAAGAEGISSTPNAIDGMRYQTKANALCAEAAAVIERQAARIARLEAALRFYRWHEPTGASWREAGRAAAAALADAPGDDKAHEADPTQGPDE